MFVDSDEIELTDPQVIDVQIAERHAAIDRLHSEIDQLEHAAATSDRSDTQP